MAFSQLANPYLDDVQSIAVLKLDDLVSSASDRPGDPVKKHLVGEIDVPVQVLRRPSVGCGAVLGAMDRWHVGHSRPSGARPSARPLILRRDY